MPNTLYNRRWTKFKNHKIGHISLWLFSLIFLICLLAPFIANDKPLIIFYKQQFYFPTLKQYTEKNFNGKYELSIDYKNASFIDLIHQDGWMIWPPIRYYYDTINYEKFSPTKPDLENLLGTDDVGRDVLTRIIYGYRISILFSLLLTIISLIIGIGIGSIQGYMGGNIDLLGQRFIEMWSSLPLLYCLIILSSFFRPNFWWFLLILALFKWVTLVDLVRAESLRTRNLEYVLAASALGVNNTSIIFKHIIPNAIVATLTFLPFLFTQSITTLTSLDFLGFGLPVGSPSLGELILQGKNNLQAPWLGITAFITVSFILTLLIFIGDALRNAMDSKQHDLPV